MVFKTHYKTKHDWLNDRLVISIVLAAFLYPFLVIPPAVLLTDISFDEHLTFWGAYGFALLVGGLLNFFVGTVAAWFLTHYNKNHLWHWLLTGSVVGAGLIGLMILMGGDYISFWAHLQFVMLGALSGCCLAFVTWWFMSPHKVNPYRLESNPEDPRKRGVGPLALIPPLIIASLLAWAEYGSKAQYELAVAKEIPWLAQIDLPQIQTVPTDPLTVTMAGPDYPPLTEACAWTLKRPIFGKRPRPHRLRVISWGDGHAEIYSAEYAEGCTSSLTHQYEKPGDYLIRFYYADLYADWFPLTRDFDYPWMNELSPIAEEMITVR